VLEVNTEFPEEDEDLPLMPKSSVSSSPPLITFTMVAAALPLGPSAPKTPLTLWKVNKKRTN